MSLKGYVASLPERIIRSALGLGAGVAKETSDLVLPAAVRNSQLYQNLISAALRFVIEQVGEVEGVYKPDDKLPDDFLKRRAAGNALEMLGLLAFRASPVWVLAALADVSGVGRALIPEIADELKSQGLLDREAEFDSVDQLLDGLERTSARLASTVNMPPLDVATLREDLRALREDARQLQPASLPTGETVRELWRRLTAESAAQQKSVFDVSSMMAMSAMQQVPDQVRWLSLTAKAGVARTGRVVGGILLDHYAATLQEIQQAGYAAFARRQLAPYARAAASQFSPRHQTLTERLLNRLS